MIRLFNVYFAERTLLLLVSETLFIFCALLASIFVWTRPDFLLALNYEHGFLQIFVATAVIVTCMYYYDLYNSVVLSSPHAVWSRLVQVLGTACVILALVYYVFPDARLGRGIFLVGILGVGTVLALWRRLFFVLNRSPRLAQQAVFLGEGPLVKPLAEIIENRPEVGIRVLGYIGPSPSSPTLLNGLPRLADIDDLAEIALRQNIDRIIITMSDRRGQLPVSTLLKLKTRGVYVQDAMDVYEALTGKIPIDSLHLSRLVFSPGFRVSTGMLVYKRVTSLLLSGLGLLLALPLIPFIALAIKLDSPGPIIFRQARVGQGGRAFTVFKFRSMCVGAEVGRKPGPASANDERVTRVGRFLRRFRLDEIPQLYNILRGDMHFVGPRPFVPAEEDEFLKLIPLYEQRLTVKPGATGWAQIHQGYCATLQDNIEKLGYDLFYIKNLSIGLDLLTIFQTAKIMLLGRGSR